MGWNSWNRFACDIDEDMAQETATALVETGLADAGYDHFNLDDCWQVDRAEDGTILADPDRFPSGIKSLADQVHNLGLKFGLYSCAGTMTCQERPGSYEFEMKDAATWAEWGTDFIKIDWCFTKSGDLPEPGQDLRGANRYPLFRDAILETGHPITLSICEWGSQQPRVWGPATGQLWRTSGDISDTFFSMYLNMLLTRDLGGFAGPGHYNDPDMLEVGNGGMTATEYRAHMGLWAMMAAPLIAGNDLRTMDDETLEILTAAEVIAVDQDPDAIPGAPLDMNTQIQVWNRPLAAYGTRAVLLFNGDSVENNLDFKFQDIGIANGDVVVRDLWGRRDIGTFGQGFGSTVQPHEGLLLRVSGREIAPLNGESRVSELPFMFSVSHLGPVKRDEAWSAPETGTNTPLTINERQFGSGLGVRSGSRVMLYLGGLCSRFSATIGVDDSAGPAGSVEFRLVGDGETVYESGVMTHDDQAINVSLPVDGIHVLRLEVGRGNDNTEDDLADWADATLICQ